MRWLSLKLRFLRAGSDRPNGHPVIQGLPCDRLCIWLDRLRQDLHYGGLQVHQGRQRRLPACFKWWKLRHNPKISPISRLDARVRARKKREKTNGVHLISPTVQRTYLRPPESRYVQTPNIQLSRRKSEGRPQTQVEPPWCFYSRQLDNGWNRNLQGHHASVSPRHQK